MNDFILDEAGLPRDPKYQKKALRPQRADHIDANTSSSTTTRREPLQLRPRTKLEQKMLDRIPERQKAALANPQTATVGGLTYSGPGFLATPKVVQFSDFVVGHVLRQPVQLTNVALGFNAFKVMPLPPLVRDVLEVEYSPQSNMSAGMCCTLTVVFSPKENTDIDTALSIMVQTGGVLTIPIQCRRKRAVVSASTTKIDFGAMVVAEKATKSVVIRNDGALAVKMTVGGEIGKLLQVQHHDPEGRPHKPWCLEPDVVSSGDDTLVTLKPFSSSTLSITFCPMEVSSFDSNLFLHFDLPDVEDILVFVAASSVDVPVFVANNAIIDFGCCFYDSLYREKVTVKNTLAAAVKVTPIVPPALSGMLEFVPKFAFAQAHSEFDFQVKWTPNEGAGAEIDAQVRFVVSDQAMPIHFVLRASLSKQLMSFSPSSIDVGPCTMGEQVEMPLELTNLARIGRTVGFTKLPPNITVSPLPVFAIGAMETVTVTIGVQPPTLGVFTQQLTLLTEHDEKYTIVVTGYGKSAVIAFGEPSLCLPVCAVGQRVTATTTLVNQANTLQRFCFVLPKGYGVEVSPQQGEIAKGQSVPIVVTFNPTSDIVDLRVPPLEDPPEVTVGAEAAAAVDAGAKGAAAKPKKLTKAEEEAERREKERLEEERRIERERRLAERLRLQQEYDALLPWEASAEQGETWSRHRTLLIPAFVESWAGKAVFLSVRCSVVKPTVVVSPQWSSCTKLQFDEVPADREVKKVVTLRNDGSTPVRLCLRPLDPFGVFRVPQPPLSSLLPGHQTELTVSFTPKSKAVYVDRLQIVCEGGNDVAVDLVGEGLPASLCISLERNTQPPTAPTIALGHSLLGDKAELPVFFSNLSPFPLQVSVSFVPSSLSRVNPNGTIPFAIHPNKFVIPSNGKVEAVAMFTPLAEGAFRAEAIVDFGAEASRRTLVFEGMGCDKGVHIAFPSAGHPATRKGPFSSIGCQPPVPGSAQHPVLLQLPPYVDAPVTQQIVVTNCKGSSGCEISVEGLVDADVKNGWKVDPVKSNIQPGAKASFVVSLNPTPLLLDSLPLANINIVSTCTFKLVVKGGMPASDATYIVRASGVINR